MSDIFLSITLTIVALVVKDVRSNRKKDVKKGGAYLKDGSDENTLIHM